MAIQPFRNGGDFEGDVTFSTSPTVPSKSTPAGDNPTVVATEAQVFNNSRTLQQVINASDDGEGNINATFPSGLTLQDDSGDGFFLMNNRDDTYFVTGSSFGGQINYNNGNTIFNGTLSTSGIEYMQDYSANYTNRSLVDKEYVDNQIEIYLKSLPSYNASTPQVLGHDASGNIQWQTP